MAAFKRMLQVGIKAENGLMRYRASKAHSTSSSSSSKEFSEKKMSSYPEHKAAESYDDFSRRMIAKNVAAIRKFRSEMKDFHYKSNEASKKQNHALGAATAVGTVVCAILGFRAGSSM